ncbi:hypothetical protein ACLB2K_043101 [Fragaria x ananassa]
MILKLQNLDWTKRVHIIEGLAHALSYMHQNCTIPIVHRNVTTSNILLNSEMVASLSDFRTARLLYPNSSNRTMLAGTRGYIAPAELMKEGSTVTLRNAKIDMFKGSMRLAVDKSGRVEVAEHASFTVMADNNLSLIEFECLHFAM